MSTGADMLKAALGYAERGWPVFPCVPDGKRPATKNGLKDATTDWRRLARWWTEKSDTNVAVCTGVASGIVVLDVDGDAGFESLRELERVWGELPRTASVVTPSGGQHFYFRHPGGEVRNTAGRLGAGLDTRGDGGYVLAPPSTVEGRPYEVDERCVIAPLPEWLIEQCRPPTEGESQPKEEWLKIMAGASEGQRNHQVARLAGYLLRRNVHRVVVDEIVHLVNRHRFKPPLSDWEVDRTVESIFTRELARNRDDRP